METANPAETKHCSSLPEHEASNQGPIIPHPEMERRMIRTRQFVKTCCPTEQAWTEVATLLHPLIATDIELTTARTGKDKTTIPDEILLSAKCFLFYGYTLSEISQIIPQLTATHIQIIIDYVKHLLIAETPKKE